MVYQKLKTHTHTHTTRRLEEHNDSESEFESSAMQLHLHLIHHQKIPIHCGPHTFPFRPYKNLGFKGSLSPNTSIFHTTSFICSPFQFYPFCSSISDQSLFLYPISCIWHTASLLSTCFGLIHRPHCLEFNYFYVCEVF